MDRRERSPHGEINVVRTLDVHGHAHPGCVGDERMRGMVSGNDDACADWLLSEVVLQNLFLDAFLDMLTKMTDHGQVHPRVHQAERVSGGDNTIE
jgi:hypothetical protein